VPYHPHAILIPLDGGHAAEEALDLAQAIASATGATLVLASVIPTVATASGDLAAVASFTPSATAEMLDQAEAVAGRYLAEQAEPMRQHGREVRTSVTRGRASAQLAAVAAANGVDLVVLATHGRAGLEGVLSGSVGQRLLARLHAPVLLLKLTEPAS
jgi:nucleotide-binding universal stress UspA family protein